MKKNVFGFIGLFAGIGAFVLLIAALFMPTAAISGSTFALYGGVNVTMALIAAALGVTAIVFGIISRKDRDKKGPRKAGIIVGVFAIIASLLSAGAFALTNEIVKYWNPNEKSTMIEDLVKDNADMKKQLDEQYQKMLDEAKK